MSLSSTKKISYLWKFLPKTDVEQFLCLIKFYLLKPNEASEMKVIFKIGQQEQNCFQGM